MSSVTNVKTPLILRLIFIVSLCELVIGGGGRFFEVGFVTLRMIFFILSILIALGLYVYKNSIKKELIIIIFSFTILLLFSSVVGYANDAPFELIFEDVKPLSFFYMILFFSLVINNVQDIKMVSKMVKHGAVFLSIAQLGIIILLLFNYIDFNIFHDKQLEIGELFFRSGFLFFYKGFLYLCIGFFFFLLSNEKYKNFFLILIFSSIVLTLVRGFILFTALISCYYVFFINKEKVLKLKWGLVILILISIGWVPFMETLGDKSSSDAVRYVQINQVLAEINPTSFFMGHGFGIGVPERPIRMENSFLEIFHKQGLFGIAFWVGLLVYIFYLYFRIKDINYKKIAMPFLLSVTFIYFESLTNPFINNPIGLTIILITIVIFSKLLDFQKQP